jgi:hypothetical protein
MADLSGVGGQFWTAEKPGLRVPGEFTAQLGQQAEAILAGGLSPGLAQGLDPRPVFELGDMAGAVAAHAADAVARFRPVTLLGQLETGELMTLFDAPNYSGGAGFAPRYIAPVTVFGAHLSSDQRYGAVRFRIDHPYWLGHLVDGDSRVVEDDHSSLTVDACADGNWLVYVSAAPTTLRQLEVRAVSGCLALVELALCPGKEMVTSETQVRIDADSPWLTVHGPGFCGDADYPRLDTLLPREALTLERFAKWIALNDVLDGLAWGVARPVKGVLQVQAQVLSSMVEGLHRRHPEYKQSKFCEEDRDAIGRIRDAVMETARSQADVEGLDSEHVMKAFMLLQEVSFQDRAKVVVAEVTSAVPEIVEAVVNLPSLLGKVRVKFAHQLREKKSEPLEVQWRRWLVVTRVTPWLLRGLLLLWAGVEPEVLHKNYLEHESFAFYRENMMYLVRELGWEMPPDQPAPYVHNGS